MVPAGSTRRRHSSRGGMADEEARTARREGAVCDGPAGRGGADGQDRSRALAGVDGFRAVTPMDTPELQELEDAPSERLDIEHKA